MRKVKLLYYKEEILPYLKERKIWSRGLIGKAKAQT